MEEAIIEHKLAQKYDPFTPMHTALLGGLYVYNGQCELAIKEAQKALELSKDYPDAYWVLGCAYLELGRKDEAIETHKKLAELCPWWTWPLGYTYAMTGNREDAEKLISDLKNKNMNDWNAWQLACIYASLGMNDEAIKHLNYKPSNLYVPWAAVLPEFKKLHDDPRFQDFVKNLNLPN